MLKKTIIVSLCGLIAVLSASCSEKKSKLNWEEGQACSIEDMDNDNGAECAKKNLIISCQNGKIEIAQCGKSCKVTNKKAHCEGAEPTDYASVSDTSRPSGNQNTTPSQSDGNNSSSRPGEGSGMSRPGAESSMPKNGDPCGDINKAGYCKDDTAIYCGDDSKLVVEKCPKGCMSDDLKNAVCIEECGNIDEVGKCVENELQFCWKENGKETLVKEDCGSSGCGMNDNNVNACLDDSSSSGSCGTYDSKGTCARKTIFYCDSNELVIKKCDNGCMYDNEQYAICIEACGNVTDLGECSDKTLKYCTYNSQGESSLIEEECAVKCGDATDSAGIAYKTCLNADGSPAHASSIVSKCGDITYNGVCEESTRKVTWCNEQHELQSIICDEACGTDETGYAGCLSKRDCGDITYDGTCSEDVLQYCNDGSLVEQTCADGCVIGASYADCYTPCGNITADGMCVTEKVLKFCDSEFGLIERTCDGNCMKFSDDMGDFYNCDH